MGKSYRFDGTFNFRCDFCHQFFENWIIVGDSVAKIVKIKRMEFFTAVAFFTASCRTQFHLNFKIAIFVCWRNLIERCKRPNETAYSHTMSGPSISLSTITVPFIRSRFWGKRCKLSAPKRTELFWFSGHGLSRSTRSSYSTAWPSDNHIQYMDSKCCHQCRYIAH